MYNGPIPSWRDNAEKVETDIFRVGNINNPNQCFSIQKNIENSQILSWMNNYAIANASQ